MIRILLAALAFLASSTSLAEQSTLQLNPEFSGVWQVQRVRRPDRAPPAREASATEMTAGDRRIRRIMTAAGRAAFDAQDPADLPANNCQSPGLPSIAMTPNLQEWRIDGETLTILHEYFSTERTVHLNETSPPKESAHTPLGYAVGKIDGRTLTITTTRLLPMPGGLSRNAPGSDSRVVTERYTLSDNTQHLRGEITIRDPKFLTEDIQLEVNLARAEAGAGIVLIPCVIESSTRHLKNGDSVPNSAGGEI